VTKAYVSETQVERGISKSKALFCLLVVKSNICEEVKPMHTNDLAPGLRPLRGIEH